MKHKNIVVWGFMLAGVLALIAGLRDLFAPGFFAMNGRVHPTHTDIIGQFAISVTFFALAVLSRIQPGPRQQEVARQ